MLNILGYNTSGQVGQTNSNGTSASSTSGPGEMSPFAEMLKKLQQMEQSNPTQYAKVSQQISTNLSAASSTALQRGNTALASKLTTLSQDFSTASQTGQLPNIGDLETTMHMVGQTNASGTLPVNGSHSGFFKSVGNVLSMAGI
jgi:hypothetical protein